MSLLAMRTCCVAVCSTSTLSFSSLTSPLTERPSLVVTVVSR